MSASPRVLWHHSTSRSTALYTRWCQESGMARFSRRDLPMSLCACVPSRCRLRRHRVPPPSPTQAHLDSSHPTAAARPCSGFAAASASRSESSPFIKGSCASALVTPDSGTAIASFATQRVATPRALLLQSADRRALLPTRQPSLRPADQRPASRRQSRSLSASERTLSFFVAKRRRSQVLSEAEMARRSRLRLACHGRCRLAFSPFL